MVTSAVRAAAAPATPLCFEDDEHYNEWLDLARSSGSLAPPDYCHDCTPLYQSRMIDIDKCRHPETIFVTLRKRLENGDIEFEQVGTRGIPSALRRHIYSANGDAPCP